LKTDINR